MNTRPEKVAERVVSRTERATLAVSRRNFVAAASALGAFLAASSRSVFAQQQCLPPACVCFLRGTSILTPQGEVAIEDLEIGDLVATSSGEAKPIKWIGRMRFEKEQTPGFGDTTPIRIDRNALDKGMPNRDLYVSRAHCLYIDGVLVPAGELVNGLSVRRCHADEFSVVEYFHIELDAHHAVLANNVPAETYAGGASRVGFDNFQEYVDLYGPDLVTIQPFAPVVGNRGGREELKSRLRSVVAPVYDRRLPLDFIRDDIANRAAALQAA